MFDSKKLEVKVNAKMCECGVLAMWLPERGRTYLCPFCREEVSLDA